MTSVLATLIVPLNLTLALLVLAVVLRLLCWRKSAVALALAGLLWSGIWSLPATTLWAGGILENYYPHQRSELLPHSQAIVVLGGHTANNRRNWFEETDSSTAILRTDTANRLYQDGRAPIIIVSGAALDGGQSEASMMAGALIKDGIPERAIIQENDSLTTHQNAIFTARKLQDLGIHQFLLVTSALHMPRAMASFRKLGMQPVAAPSPPQIFLPDIEGFLTWLPDLRSLQASRSIIKEYLGLVVYKIRGWA